MKYQKTFDGKLYILEDAAWSKQKMQRSARQFRKDGFSARVVGSPEGWSVYTRARHTKVHRSGIVPKQYSRYGR